MSAAVRAEWTKLRTVAAPGWLLAGVAAATVALGTVVANALSCAGAGCAGDAVKSALAGVQLGQAVVAVLAVLVIGDEYATGMIATTFIAVPRRPVVLAAKAVVLVGPVLLAGAVGVLGSLAAGHRLLPFDVWEAATWRAAGGSVLYLALVALLGMGIAAAVRDPAPAIGITLGLLYLFPILASTVSDPDWHRHLLQIGPSSAGLTVQATVDVHSLPIGPWAGLGVLALWAAGALLLGGSLVLARDA